MPKRRVPGHLNRQKRGRRRVDAPGPGMPPAPAQPSEVEAAPTDGATAAPPPVPTGRPLRPTQRLSATAGRFTRQPVAAEPQIDYRYVVHDLRQIGALAVFAFVVLVVLSFVIR